jgi:hypothetical protein
MYFLFVSLRDFVLLRYCDHSISSRFKYAVIVLLSGVVRRVLPIRPFICPSSQIVSLCGECDKHTNVSQERRLGQQNMWFPISLDTPTRTSENGIHLWLGWLCIWLDVFRAKCILRGFILKCKTELG